MTKYIDTEKIRNLAKKTTIFILTWLARGILWRFQPIVIAVVGSVGKTSTKDAIAVALGSIGTVRKAVKSHNSEIGVPLTILGLSNAWGNWKGWIWNIARGIAEFFMLSYPRFLVVEVGSDRPGDIPNIGRWLRPHIVVVTSFGEVPVHVEYFDSPRDLYEEDRSMIRFLRPGGIVIANADDNESLEATKSKRSSMTYGIESEHAEARALALNNLFDEDGTPIGISFKISFEGACVPVTVMGALGKQHVYPILSACEVASLYGGSIIEVAQSLEHKYRTPKGRMRILKGKNNSVVIDDTYNSSPIALSVGLNAVSEMFKEMKEIKGKKSKGRLIAVLGEMRELGRFSVGEHKKAGALVAQLGFDIIATVGSQAENLLEGANEEKEGGQNYLVFENSMEAGDWLKEEVSSDDVVYIKGSQGTRMEKVTKSILANPEEAADVLVRQEPFWVDR